MFLPGKMNAIQKGGWCRACINQKLHLKLERQDCLYAPYVHICSNCGKSAHIVLGVAPTRFYKLL